MGHYARDCRAEEKVKETINLALNVATNGGILLMAQNEELNTKGFYGVKDDVEILIANTRKSKKDEQPNNREPELEERELQWPERQLEDENGRENGRRKERVRNKG